jgi:hypothetical protein
MAAFIEQARVGNRSQTLWPVGVVAALGEGRP